MVNKFKLKGKIAESGMRQDEVAALIGTSPASFSAKVNGRSGFTVSEVDLLRNVLKLDKEDVFNIFFAEDVI